MNKIVLITGATSGFGQACARKFASEGGYDIIITGRRKERLDALKRELENGTPHPPATSATPQLPAAPPRQKTPRPSGGDPLNDPLGDPLQVWPLVFDVQDKDAVFAAIDSLPVSWKKIDILVNNAGLALGRDLFQDASLDDWETMIDTNVKGLLYVSKAVIPLLIVQKKGHIINIGSTAAKEVYEKGNVYCASKHAVDAISKAMRIDLLSQGIRVTAVHPGAADTEFSNIRFKGDKEQAQKVYEGYIPLSAADVADVVYYCTTLPSHICINDLTLTCTAQANSFYLHKTT